MSIFSYARHPGQLLAIIQWRMRQMSIHRRDPKSESPSLQSCFRLLNLTSRTFAVVIRELHRELAGPVCLFYLVLRGLDTIEDDMTLDIKKKEPMLRNFHEYLAQDGWTFNGSGENEKHRELLVHFDDIITELKKLHTGYYDVIRDIANKMGNGMADYAMNEDGINTVEEYERYCHYVAGLVGEGLTQLFVQAKMVDSRLPEQSQLIDAMGHFIQKSNITKDVHEDWQDGRRFWPGEIWRKYFTDWEEIFESSNREKALYCSSEMVLNALKDVEGCLSYIASARITDQSVFNFVAIPQSKAMAELELAFQNPTLFEGCINITKDDASDIISSSTQNHPELCMNFRKHVRRICQRNDPGDPSYSAISSQCIRIEQYIEVMYPQRDRSSPKQVFKLANIIPLSPLISGMVISLTGVIGLWFSILIKEKYTG